MRVLMAHNNLEISPAYGFLDELSEARQVIVVDKGVLQTENDQLTCSA